MFHSWVNGWGSGLGRTWSTMWGRSSALYSHFGSKTKGAATSETCCFQVEGRSSEGQAQPRKRSDRVYSFTFHWPNKVSHLTKPKVIKEEGD